MTKRYDRLPLSSSAGGSSEPKRWALEVGSSLRRMGEIAAVMAGFYFINDMRYEQVQVANAEHGRLGDRMTSLESWRQYGFRAEASSTLTTRQPRSHQDARIAREEQ